MPGRFGGNFLENGKSFWKMKKTSPMVVPSLERLAEIADGRAAARRAELQAYARLGGEACKRKRKERENRRVRRMHTLAGRLVYTPRSRPAGDPERPDRYRFDPGHGTRPANRLGIAGWKVLASRMLGYDWMSAREMRNLIPEFAFGSQKAWTRLLDVKGITERARNADFPDSIAVGEQWPPKYFYRLTEEGAALAAQWRDELARVRNRVQDDKGETVAED